MLIPHGSEPPMSIAVSERALRFLTPIAVAVALIALIGVGTIIARLGRLGPVGANTGSAASPAPSKELASLRGRVSELHGTLATIRAADMRLREVAGVPAVDTARLMRRFISRIPIFGRWASPATPAARGRAPGTPAIPVAPPVAVHSTASGDVVQTRAVADSLIAHAARVATEYGALADSASKGKRDSGRKSR